MAIAQGGASTGGVTVRRDRKTGSDCSGTSGDKNRELTLDNSLTYIISVVVNKDTKMNTDEYTTSGSTVTFLNEIDDDMKIEVVYI